MHYNQFMFFYNIEHITAHDYFCVCYSFIFFSNLNAAPYYVLHLHLVIWFSFLPRLLEIFLSLWFFTCIFLQLQKLFNKFYLITKSDIINILFKAKPFLIHIFGFGFGFGLYSVRRLARFITDNWRLSLMK